MQKIDLSGTWSLECSSQEHPIANVPATVPGCVHTDLLAANIIEDPYYRDRELEVQWIGQADWAYTRSFEIDAEVLGHDHVNLNCEGLDTFAAVTVNGTQISTTDNMFRSWEWEVKQRLKPGANEIQVKFTSPLPYGDEKQKQHYLIHTGDEGHRIPGGAWVRKEACNYGWDWGPKLVTSGIWRPIYLSVWNDAKIEEIYTNPELLEEGKGRLNTSARVNFAKGPVNAKVRTRLKFGNDVIIDSETELPQSGSLEESFEIESIQKWWPAGMGEQPLYDLYIELLSSEGEIMDTRSLRVGFRNLELVTEFDEWGQSFKFRANGIDFFAKGANWIPADTFDNRVNDEHIRDLLQCSVDANMNCMRVWGGAIYERDAFYDICDELGICVWQDFAFACTAYPLHLPEFIENISIEAEENIKRIRHHPSLALWCGNNELEHMDGFIGDEPGAMRWDHYSKWFDIELRAIVSKHHPTASYWPASEHSPIGNRTPRANSSDPRWGDAHLWKVWHGREPFEWYRTSFHRFCSEFGFQAFPHPATIESYTDKEDRNITSRIMEFHQRSPSGNPAIMHYLLDWFRLPTSFDNSVWLSQILQSLGIKYAIEHWRRNMPRCMGATYWQLNDCWPVASWSSLDSARRWKALHYDAKRFFARDLVSVVEDSDAQTLDLHITSDNLETREASVSVKAWHSTTGELLDEQTFSTQTPSNGAQQVATYHPENKAKDIANYSVIFEILLCIGGIVVSENMATWVRPKTLDTFKPNIQTTVSTDESGQTVIELTSDRPALWAWLEKSDDPDARWSDNFFHLFPGRTRTITESSSTGSHEARVVKSLYDTYS